MVADPARRARLRTALEAAGLDALVCVHGPDVLLVSGYWPVVGLSFALVTASGAVSLLVPEDERELALRCGADEVHTFVAGSLDSLDGPAARVAPALAHLLRAGVTTAGSRIGYAAESVFSPSSYAATHAWGASLATVLADALPGASFTDATELLAECRALLTPTELDRLRVACRLAAIAYTTGSSELRLGMRETEVAAAFIAPFSTALTDDQSQLVGGYAYCMSGPRSARASAAYQRTSSRVLEIGDLVLVHCNSYVDGFCTDITRTFTLAPITPARREMYDAVHAARAAALAVIAPGVRAADVDHAARQVLEARGFGAQFPHALGHGVGFVAIDHDARPRIHPLSEDVLEAGMVFNVEPAIYIDGLGGMRHCDMVAVSDSAVEILTPFLSEAEALFVHHR